MQPYFPSGLAAVPHLQPGSHLAHIFAAGDELREVMVPYFKAGLENNERCLWVTGEAFNADQARAALRAVVPDLDTREFAKQIEIANSDEWYASGEMPRPDDLVRALMQRGEEALAFGYAGLRTGGNCAWVERHQWAGFMEYERLVHRATRDRPMICICNYCIDQMQDGSHLALLECHDLALPSTARRHRSATRAAVITADAKPDAVDQTWQRQKRTFDLAMMASQMGTWRYTLADKICTYDENAQRLYGLTEARFVHDEEGVKSKFHPDDLGAMWSHVAAALDPQGDGRYDVEYRVKQRDGSWRWLSAWGLVEFEGEGSARRPIAIAGASRDLTERKQAEDLQRLILSELNHRVKNTLATIQALAAQTLRGARDLPSAKDALDHRIRAMAQAHDLLIGRAWSGADLADIVRRALDAFTPVQVTMAGPALDISPKHALALSLAVHELATNAIKYGALSCPEGRVSVQWRVDEGMLHLTWEESGGPPVTPPLKKGFGSRLLEDLLARDLDGHTNLSYDVEGLRCSIIAKL